MVRKPNSLNRVASFVLFGLLALTTRAECQEAAIKRVTFDDHVKPILIQRCSSCHSGERKEADLNAVNYTSLMLGGGSGEVISAGSTDDSYLFQLITHADSPKMPPSGTKIPEQEIKTIADWIIGGALENEGSKPVATKPKADLSLSNKVITRPEVVSFPLRLPLEPVITSARPSLTSIATSPWAHLAAIAAPKQILLYDTRSLHLVGVLPMIEGVAHDLKFSRSGSLLLAGGGVDGQRGQIIVWDVKTGERVASVGNELDTVLAGDISSNHELIALGGPKKVVKVFSIADGNLDYEITKHTDWVTALEFSPDGKYLVTGDRNGGLIVWEAESGNELFVLKGHSKSIASVSWRGDSKILASTSEDMTVRIWEIQKGSQVKSWNAHAGGATALEFTRDGNLATAGRDNLAKYWNQNGELLKEFAGLGDVAVTVAFCDETTRVLAGDWSGKLLVWDANDGGLLGDLAANPQRLAERLELAEQSLSAARNQHESLLPTLEQSQIKLNEVLTALENARKTLSHRQNKITEGENQLNAVRIKFESTSSQLEQWRAELTEKINAKPLIEQTFAKAEEASAALPEDKEMKESVAQLKSKAVAIESRIAELENLISDTNQQKDTAKSELDGLTVQLQSSRNELEQSNGEVGKLESERSKLAKRVEDESAAVSQAQHSVASAQQSVDKWNDEIEFLKQLNSLNNQLEELQQVARDRQKIVDQAEEKLRSIQQAVDEAKLQRHAVDDQSDALQQRIFQLRGGG